MFWLPFLFGLVPILGISLLLLVRTRDAPWRLLTGSIFIIILGIFYALSFIEIGATFSNIINEQVGHALLVLISIIGGSMISTAMSEIRKGNGS